MHILYNQVKPKIAIGGFSLIELMIAMLVGLFIVGAIFVLYIGNKQTYNINEAQARLQENGRFVLDILARELRQAGYKECMNDPDNPAICKDDTFITGEVIQGWAGVSSGVPSGLPFTLTSSNYTANTDMVQVQYKKSDLSTGLACDGETIIHLYYIRESASSGQPGLYEWEQKLELDDKTNTTICDGLNRTTNHNEEIIEGVYDMQIRYGLDTDSDLQIDSYADNPSNWGQVIAVRVDLLIGSLEDNLVQSPMSLPFERNDGSFFTATDNRLYQIFSTTIALRNRIRF